MRGAASWAGPGAEAAGLSVVAVGPDGSVLWTTGPGEQVFGINPGDRVGELAGELWEEVRGILAGGERSVGIFEDDRGVCWLRVLEPAAFHGGSNGCLCLVALEGDAFARALGPSGSPAELLWERDAIIDTCTAGIWVCDDKGTVVRVNPESARLAGVRPDEVLGRSTRDLVKEGFFDESATLECLRTRSRVEILQTTRSGRKTMVTAQPVFKGKRLFRVVITERDVTELEEAYRQLEEQKRIRDAYERQVRELEEMNAVSRTVIAKSPPMVQFVRQAVRVAKTDASLLILGESGVGKGVIADLIHRCSHRSSYPLIKINCGAIPESLIESELFGYARGAFTGAQTRGKPGYLEEAHGGILFLDEVAELPQGSQVKLLRVLEDGQVTRLGSTTGTKVDVRIIAATNRNLEDMVAAGRFREDLYYRLNVIPLRIPPLRERPECVLALLQHYIAEFSTKHGEAKQLTRAAFNALLEYSYPGNVRELINLCERLVVLSEGEHITYTDLPRDVMDGDQVVAPVSAEHGEGKTLAHMVAELERRVLARARRTYRNQYEIGDALGISQATVARKMIKYGIR